MPNDEQREETRREEKWRKRRRVRLHGIPSNAIDPAFVCITCLLLTADIFSHSLSLGAVCWDCERSEAPSSRSSSLSAGVDRRRTRNYHGEEGPLEISFITGGTVNPRRIDTMMVQRRHHGAADLSHSERSNCSILEIKAERRNLAKMVFEGIANFSGKGEGSGEGLLVLFRSSRTLDLLG